MMVSIHRHSLRLMFRADRVAVVRPRLNFGVDQDGETWVAPAVVEIAWTDGSDPLLLVDDALAKPEVMDRFLADLQTAMATALAAKAPGDPLGVVGPLQGPQSPPRAILPR